MRKTAKKIATQRLERLVVYVPATLFNDINTFSEYMHLDRTNFIRLAITEFINKKRNELSQQTK